MATAGEVAQWMYDEVLAKKILYQDSTADEIYKKYGESYASFSNAGNLIIDKKVLAHFKKLSNYDVVWDRSERLWRLRESYDSQGRQA